MTYIDWVNVDTRPANRTMAIEFIIMGLFLVAFGFLLLIMNL